VDLDGKAELIRGYGSNRWLGGRLCCASLTLCIQPFQVHNQIMESGTAYFRSAAENLVVNEMITAVRSGE